MFNSIPLSLLSCFKSKSKKKLSTKPVLSWDGDDTLVIECEMEIYVYFLVWLDTHNTGLLKDKNYHTHTHTHRETEFEIKCKKTINFLQWNMAPTKIHNNRKKRRKTERIHLIKVSCRRKLSNLFVFPYFLVFCIYVRIFSCIALWYTIVAEEIFTTRHKARATTTTRMAKTRHP